MVVSARSPLRAEKRVNKLGHLVTKHVRDGQAAPEASRASLAATAATAAYTPSTSDEVYADHIEHALGTVEQMNRDGLETLHTMTTTNARGERVWKLSRQREHDRLLNDLLDGFADVPREGKAIMSGGVGGAGKSYVLQHFAMIDTAQYATVNPDDIKELMAERGLIPEVEGLSPMEVSPLVHEEASAISKQLAERLRRQGTNIIFDLTMSNLESTRSKVDQLRSAGYEVDAVFVDVDLETSQRRAGERHRRGWEQHRRGEGHGGRILPPEVIEAQRDESGQFATKNRRVFETLKAQGLFASARTFDNSVDGRDPEEITR